MKDVHIVLSDKKAQALLNQQLAEIKKEIEDLRKEIKKCQK